MARALEFLVLTAARSGEVLGAQWPRKSISPTAFWTVPGETHEGRAETFAFRCAVARVEILTQLPRLKRIRSFPGPYTGSIMSGHNLRRVSRPPGLRRYRAWLFPVGLSAIGPQRDKRPILTTSSKWRSRTRGRQWALRRHIGAAICLRSVGC